MEQNEQIKVVLTEARKLITDPENWCQGSFHQVNEDGEWSHCAWGAVEAVVYGRHGQKPLRTKQPSVIRERATTALSDAIEARGRNISIGVFNDTTTHQEVLALFDEAIAAL